MKKIKSLIALILVFILMISTYSVAFANDSDEIALQSAEVEASANEEIVARLYLCSTIYVFPIAGHTWIYVENLTDKPMTVGLYTAQAGEGVSVGTHAFSSSDGWGVYYNLERYRQGMKFGVKDVLSASVDLTQAELDELSRDIANYVNYWDLYFNCAFFSFSIWNQNAPSFLIPLVLPAISHFEVLLSGGRNGVLTMDSATADKVYRQKGSGSNATLVPVSAGTLD